MNKNKGIWLVIAAILVIGIVVTLTTSSFVNRRKRAFDGSIKEQLLPTETNPGNPGQAGGAGSPLFPASLDREDPGSEAAAASSKEGGGRAAARESKPRGNAAAAAKNGGDGTTLKILPKTATGSVAMMPANNEGGAQRAAIPNGSQAGQAENRAGSTHAAPFSTEKGGLGAGSGLGSSSGISSGSSLGSGVSEAAPPISPLGPGGKATDGDPEEKKAYYNRLLSDLDTQILTMRGEASDSTTNSMKTMADKELKLWNVEMNMIYTDISNAADEVTKGKLENSQQAFMKSRDAKAEAAAKKYSGGTLEGVEYTASLAESTRQRTYALVADYLDFLPSE